MKVRDKLFSKSGDLKIKCTAAIDTIYWRSNEESIQVIMVMIILMVISWISFVMTILEIFTKDTIIRILISEPIFSVGGAHT